MKKNIRESIKDLSTFSTKDLLLLQKFYGATDLKDLAEKIL